MKNIIIKAAAISLSALSMVSQIDQVLKLSNSFQFVNDSEIVLSIRDQASLPIVTQGYPVSYDEELPSLGVFVAHYWHYNYEPVTVFFMSTSMSIVKTLAQKMLSNLDNSILPEHKSSQNFKMALREESIELAEVIKIGGESKMVYTIMSLNSFYI
jgi:maltodextrin utilization protein YvdJ